MSQSTSSDSPNLNMGGTHLIGETKALFVWFIKSQDSSEGIMSVDMLAQNPDGAQPAIVRQLPLITAFEDQARNEYMQIASQVQDVMAQKGVRVTIHLRRYILDGAWANG